MAAGRHVRDVDRGGTQIFVSFVSRGSERHARCSHTIRAGGKVSKRAEGPLGNQLSENTVMREEGGGRRGEGGGCEAQYTPHGRETG